MGSPPTEPGRPEPRPGFPDEEAPVHEVTIAGPFLMSATEVTHAQYHHVVGTSPSESAVAKRAAPFGLRMMAFDPFIQETLIYDHGVMPATLSPAATPTASPTRLATSLARPKSRTLA